MELINTLKTGHITIKNPEFRCAKIINERKPEGKLETSEIEKISVGPDLIKEIYSRGDTDSSSGAEGKFQIYDGDNRVCTVFWSWSKKGNKFEIQDQGEDYGIMTTEEWNREGTDIGFVRVAVSKR